MTNLFQSYSTLRLFYSVDVRHILSLQNCFQLKAVESGTTGTAMALQNYGKKALNHGGTIGYEFE